MCYLYMQKVVGWVEIGWSEHIRRDMVHYRYDVKKGDRLYLCVCVCVCVVLFSIF